MRSAFPRRRVIKQRILTGAVVLPLLIVFILYATPLLFNLLVCLVTVLALVEFYGMSLPAEPKGERWLAVGGGALLIALFSFLPVSFTPALLTAVLLAFAIFFLLRFRDLKTVVTRLGLVILGFLYLPLLLGHISHLRGLPDGREWVFLVLLLVMAGDSAAYFVGINLGRHKLYPAISPNKSIEGAIGGLAGSLAGVFIARSWFLTGLDMADCLLLGLAAGTLAQLGDLFESMLKRSFGVKDSGRMIPGHGGILDRLDSLIFAFPLVYYYAFWLSTRHGGGG